MSNAKAQRENDEANPNDKAQSSNQIQMAKLKGQVNFKCQSSKGKSISNVKAQRANDEANPNDKALMSNQKKNFFDIF
jgi:hypothetical protein